MLQVHYFSVISARGRYIQIRICIQWCHLDFPDSCVFGARLGLPRLTFRPPDKAWVLTVTTTFLQECVLSSSGHPRPDPGSSEGGLVWMSARRVKNFLATPKTTRISTRLH